MATANRGDEKYKLSSGDSPAPLTTTAAPHASGYIKPQNRKPHDPAITFEEYHYWALQTREEEKGLTSPKFNWREVMLRRKNEPDGEPVNGHRDAESHTFSDHNFVRGAHGEGRAEISDEEWTNASRAFRTASWGACKFLLIAISEAWMVKS
jgi:hypothetical protein